MRMQKDTRLMVWFQVDDGFYDHPKVKSLPRGPVRNGAVALWNQAGSWCARYLTDGQIPARQVEEFGMKLKDAEALVAALLWHDPENPCHTGECPPAAPGHFLYHEWPKHQRTKAQVEADRAAARERQRNKRRSSGGVTP